MKTEILNQQFQHKNNNNNLKRGRNMKYFSIILIVMVTALIGRDTEPQTGWFFEQSTQQSFYLFIGIAIDGEVVVGDGTGEGDGGCELLGTCDVVGAFRRGVCSNPANQFSQDLCVALGDTWNTDEEICIGWRYADSNGSTMLPLMGKEGFEGDTQFTYANTGEPAYIKVYDSSNGSILDLTPSSELPGWSRNVIFNIDGTSTANNTFGCNDATACNYDPDATADDGSCEYISEGKCDCDGNVLDECGVCGGDNADQDCAGVCFGLSVDTWCDGVCGVTGLEDDECGVCGGNGAVYECGCEDIPSGYCDCNGNVTDCAGDCGGISVVDECGVCGGPGSVYCGGGISECNEEDCPDTINYCLDLHSGANLISFYGLPKIIC